jgi:bifunctional enzyme CysN/CysC
LSSPAPVDGLLRFLTAGSVDDGKSTLIGRLLCEAHGVYEDQLESVRKASMRRETGLDLALITDGLRAEREQAITIDVAYRYFSSSRRKFIIADTPGHEQYTRNMITGASTADAAVILVDARKGLLKQTRRHAYISWRLGIRQIIVAINKMDSVDFDQHVFESICEAFRQFAALMHGIEQYFIPVSALDGDNVVFRSQRMPWYRGLPLLELLETLPVAEDRNLGNFRFPVQRVLRPDRDFRGYAGQIIAGTVSPGQKVLALPSGRTTTVRQVLLYKDPLDVALAPQSVVLTLEDNIDLGRGDMLASPDHLPMVANSLVADLIWMSETPLRLDVPYLIKHTSQTLCCSFTTVFHKVDIHTLEDVKCDTLNVNEIGMVEIQAHKELYFDAYGSNRPMGSFIVIDPQSDNTVGAGMIIGPLTVRSGHDRQINLPFSQTGQRTRGLTVWFTGLSGAGKTTIANALCTELLARGFRVEMLDGDIIRRHLCSDLGFGKEDRDENIRRIGFVAELLTRNGAIVLVSAISPYRNAREEVRGRISDFLEVYVNAPLNVCEQRDVKGLYRKARDGEITGFTGIDDPYEAPLAPEIECKTDRESATACRDKVLGAVLDFFSQR